MLPDVGHSGRCADSYRRVDISIGFITGLIIKNQKPIQVVGWIDVIDTRRCLNQTAGVAEEDIHESIHCI